MKIKCINNKYLTSGLTLNKYYQVTGIDEIGYKIIDDRNYNFWYTKELFQQPEDNREEKLNELLK